MLNKQRRIMLGIKSYGFTAIELLLTISIALILVVIAVPSFNEIALNNKIKSNVNDFHLAALQAHNEAITREVRVTLCKSSNLTQCTTSGDWSQGWILFTENINQNAAFDVGELVLKTHAALPTGTTFKGSTNVVNYVSYVESGYLRTTAGGLAGGTIALCDARGASDGRDVELNTAGLPSVADPSSDCTP